MANEVEEGSSNKIMPGFVGHRSNLGFILRVVRSHSVPLVYIIIYVHNSSLMKIISKFLFLKLTCVCTCNCTCICAGIYIGYILICICIS